MKNIAVFCGSNFGNDPLYLDQTNQLADLLVSKNINVIYGGGAVGLMGALANRVLEQGGNVTGVIPERLSGAEIAHNGLTKLHVVATMHERKALMAELSDGFIALPGGIGTLEEIIEVFTWTQLGFHQKPCGLLNIGGFYDKLFGFLIEMQTQGFLSSYHLNSFIIESEVETLFSKLSEQKIEYQPKWIK
jgi:uncharacterized protein (TIGR00730 family)